MSSHLYEVALFGEFFGKDLKAVLNRITLHSESSTQTHIREITFEPIDAAVQRDRNEQPIMLRARKELIDQTSSW